MSALKMFTIEAHLNNQPGFELTIKPSPSIKEPTPWYYHGDGKWSCNKRFGSMAFTKQWAEQNLESLRDRTTRKDDQGLTEPLHQQVRSSINLVKGRLMRMYDILIMIITPGDIITHITPSSKDPFELQMTVESTNELHYQARMEFPSEIEADVWAKECGKVLAQKHFPKPIPAIDTFDPTTGEFNPYTQPMDKVHKPGEGPWKIRMSSDSEYHIVQHYTRQDDMIIIHASDIIKSYSPRDGINTTKRRVVLNWHYITQIEQC